MCFAGAADKKPLAETDLSGNQLSEVFRDPFEVGLDTIVGGCDERSI